jgi:hypothetical protein
MTKSTWLLLLGVLLATSYRKPRRGSTFKQWSKDDCEAFRDAIQPLGVPIDSALQVYAAESGLNPAASSGIAWGLCQATAPTLRAVGWFNNHKTAKEFGTLSVELQSPWISQILAMQLRTTGMKSISPLDLYVLNFSPAAAKSGANVIYSAPSKEYMANKSLDAAGKGYIDRADLQRALDRARQSQAYQITSEQFRTLGVK